MNRATALGGLAAVIWGSIGLLIVLTGAVPPFQLTAMVLTIATVGNLVRWRFGGVRIRDRFVLPTGAWIAGVVGFFGFHAGFFLAIRTAPPVTVNLIIAIWPLLLVLLSAFLPGNQLRPRHIVGALFAFGGVALMVSDGSEFGFDAKYILGYAAALVASLAWAYYSLANRLYSDVSSDAVVGYSAVTALLALFTHLAFETTVWPVGWQWLAVLALAVGPLGIAFYLWDHGTKRGDLQLLAVLAYAEPLLGTLLLIGFGFGVLTWQVGAACVLIVGGAVIASRTRRRQPPPPGPI